MAITKFQPVLPAPLPFTEAELNFHDEEPPRFFPDNQNSNWGLHRKVFSNQMQKLMDQISLLYNEIFVDTSLDYLANHEVQAGLPVAPTGYSVSKRRELIKSRLSTGPFTDARIRNVIEGFIFATFGDAILFTPSGIPFVAGGIPFGSGEAGVLTSLYRIYEDYRNFTIEIWIKNTVAPDTVALTRELNRIFPAGITLTLDTTKTDVLSYWRVIRNLQPQGHWQLDNNPNDNSGNADNGTFFGTPTSVASLVSTAAGGVSAMNFNGTTQYMTIPHTSLLDVGDKFAVEFWIKPAAFTGSPRILARGTNGIDIYLDTAGVLKLQQTGGVTTLNVSSSISLVAGTTYHVVVQKNGATSKIYINGVDRTVFNNAVTFVDTANAYTVARQEASVGVSNFLNAVLDELAIYERMLTPAEILEHYNTGLDIP